MEINLKNLLLAGIGTLAYTYDKSATMIEELVKKGELTFNQGRELNEELKKKVKNAWEAKTDSEVLTVEKLNEILSSLNLVTKDELEELKNRISTLESK